MKTVILAGGLGSRLAEETEVIPKPMVEIGGRPIIWHIMKLYAHHGFKEFVVAIGYKGEVLKRYFFDHYSLGGDVSIDYADGRIDVGQRETEDWKVHLVDTGQDTMTGGRLHRLRDQLKDQTFMVTYGDGVSNIDIGDLLEFHKRHGKIATVTAVHPPARFGELILNDDMTAGFSEKPQTHEGWISGGFMVFEPAVFDYIDGDESILEIAALERLGNIGQLAAYKHDGYWQCMDTLRDRRQLEAAWKSGEPQWRVW